MLTAQEIETLKKTITQSSRPLIFFDDDADGLCSYLLARKANIDAHGLRAARGPQVTHHFIGFVTRHQPDQVIILDKPLVSEEFTQQVTTPTLWLDHHDPQAYEIHKHRSHLTYLNPAVHDTDDHRPTSFWVYQAVQGPLWIATVGITSDWDTSLLEEFRKKYPDLAPKTNEMHDALYNSKLGEIIRMFNFCLKGTTRQINDCVEALTHIKDPNELLDASTPAGNHVHRHVKPILQEYTKQFSAAQNGTSTDGVYVYVFNDVDTSLVTNVANEMLTKIQDDILIIGRQEKERVNFSMRSSNKPLPEILEQALLHVDGYGGGHEFACGGSIAQRDWETFVKHIRQ
jgi:single-stranded DNA-specific DHH superfamily exonuclease